MDGEKVATTVTILGGEYRVKGPANPEYVHMVARLVDERMKEVAERQGIVSPARVAILTSLNLADELLRDRQLNEEWSSVVEERTIELAERLAAAVGTGEDSSGESLDGAAGGSLPRGRR